MGTRLISDTKRKRITRTSKIRDRKIKINSNKFRLSNLTFENEKLYEAEISSFIPMLYNGLKSKYPTIENLKVENDTPIVIINAIESFLSSEFMFVELNFTKRDNERFVQVYKTFEYDEYTVWYIFFNHILKLKKDNFKLYDILVGFISSLPFSTDADDSLINSQLEMFGEHIEWDEDYDKSEIEEMKKDLKNLKKMQKVLNDKSVKNNWLEKLNSYFPKKQTQKALKELLLKATDINFMLPYQFVNATECSQDKGEYLTEFQQYFGVLLEEDDNFTKNYVLESINAHADNGIIPPLDGIEINEKGIITRDFSIEQKELTELCSFIGEFNGLLTELN